MRTITILDENDIISPEDYCRPLELMREYSDAVYTTSTYSGRPINNLKWTKIYTVLGNVWFGRKYKEYLKGSNTHYEFVRGDIPESHILKLEES